MSDPRVRVMQQAARGHGVQEGAVPYLQIMQLNAERGGTVFSLVLPERGAVVEALGKRIWGWPPHAGAAFCSHPMPSRAAMREGGREGEMAPCLSPCVGLGAVVVCGGGLSPWEVLYW